MTAWRDVTGSSIQGELVGFYAGMVYLRTEQDAFIRFPLERLDQSGQDRAFTWARAYLGMKRRNELPPLPPAWGKLWGESLVKIAEGRARPFDLQTQDVTPEFFLLFFASQRDRDSREFFPRIRRVVRAAQENGWQNFLPVYISRDRQAADMQAQLEQLEWAGVRYPDRDLPLILGIEPDAIPAIVVLDRQGNILLQADHDQGEEALVMLWREFRAVLEMTNGLK